MTYRNLTKFVVLAAASTLSVKAAAQENSQSYLEPDDLAVLEQRLIEAENAVLALREAYEIALRNRERTNRAAPISRDVAANIRQSNAQEPSNADQNAPIGEYAFLSSVSIDPGFAVGTSVAPGVSGRSLRSNLRPDLELVGTTDDAKASLSLSFDLSRPVRLGSDRFSAQQLNLSATTSLDEGEGQFGGLRGPSDGTEIKLSYVYYSAGMDGLTDRRVDAQLLDAVLRAEAICKATKTAAECDPNSPDITMTEYLREHLGERAAFEFVQSVTPNQVWYLGVEGSAAQNKFSFFEPDSISTDSSSELDLGATIFGGLLLGDSLQTSVGGSFTYTRKIDAQPQVTLCQMLDASSFTQCRTSASGAPGRSTQSIVGVEFRHALDAPLGQYSRFAIAPEFNFDLESDAYSIDVPLYFIPEESGSLRGGIRASYLNKKDDDGDRSGDFNIGVFVGVPFSTFRQ